SAPPTILTFALHGALPISRSARNAATCGKSGTCCSTSRSSACSSGWPAASCTATRAGRGDGQRLVLLQRRNLQLRLVPPRVVGRSEEHTSELQSRENLVCR